VIDVASFSPTRRGLRVSSYDPPGEMSNFVHTYSKSSGAYSMLEDHLVGLFLLDENEMKTNFVAFQEEMVRLKSPIRPDRHAPRKELTDAQKARNAQYNKKRR
jgi:hypothetical protein